VQAAVHAQNRKKAWMNLPPQTSGGKRGIALLKPYGDVDP